MMAWLARRRAAHVVVWAVVGLAGCAGSSSNGTTAEPAGSSDFGNNASAGPTEGSSSGGGGNQNSGNGGGLAALPPEMKVEDQYKAPVATGNFVWSANPTSGRVAYINAATFQVQTAEAGNGPTYLAAVADATHPTDDDAIVLNTLSQDATLLRVDSHGTLTTQTYAATDTANAWAVSKSGRWAIAWTNAAFVATPDPLQGFQVVAVMDLSAPTPGSPAKTSTILAVGYRPVQIAFTQDDSRAFVVTEDGISVINLTSGPTPVLVREDALSMTAGQAPAGDGGSGDAASADAAGPDAQGHLSTDASSDGGLVEAGDDDGAGFPPTDPAVDASSMGQTTAAPDVSFTPDGAYALIRRDGVAAIVIDSLVDGTLTTVPLSGAPTDLTISPQGDFAIAVLRDTSTVVVLPIPGIVAAPASAQAIPIAGQTIGRAIITADAKSVMLFTTVAPVDSLTVLTLGASPSFRTVMLHGAVQAVFPTADGKYAIVLHSVPSSSDPSVKGAFSVVPIAQDLPALIESVPAPPTAVALSNDRALISVSDGPSNTYGLYMAIMPSLEVRHYPLASAPTAVGIAAGAGRGYVAQDYSEGRITFVDLSETGADDGGAFTARTITGFELNAGIVVGRAQ